MTEDSRNRRENFRLVYPLRSMPTICIDENDYRISEISISGLRFQVQNPAGFPIGDEVRGVITFDDGVQIEVAGVTLRWDKREIILAPVEGLTFQRIVTEQRSLIKAFPLLRYN